MHDSFRKDVFIKYSFVTPIKSNIIDTLLMYSFEAV